MSDALVTALDESFGDPLDAYVNGSQTWLRDDGPGGMTLEWRLHPVAGFRRPPQFDTYEVFPAIAQAVVADERPAVAPDELWDGLEVFPAYGDDVEPATLRACAAEALGIAPDAFGLVDHERVGDEWERSGGKTSIVAALLDQLETQPD